MYPITPDSRDRDLASLRLLIKDYREVLQEAVDIILKLDTDEDHEEFLEEVQEYL